jgi:cyanate lyase
MWSTSVACHPPARRDTVRPLLDAKRDKGLSFGQIAEEIGADLYEVLQVYGPAFRALIHEEFGDGIMSAINFKAGVEKVEHEEGDRVRITLEGKFLPYAW